MQTRTTPGGTGRDPVSRHRCGPALGRVAVFLLSGMLGFVACTGTSEPRPPTLLIVGVADAGMSAASAGRLLLVEDVTGTAPPGDPRLVPLPDSARPLQAPAVAFDLEDRALTRSALWVLTRAVADDGGSPEVSAYLQRFTVDEIDPLAPTGFAEDVAATVVLTEPGGGGVLDGLSLTSPFTCPRALQVDRGGTLAVVLDDPRACGGADHPELWLVPLDGEEPRALQGTNDLAPLPAYLDQRPDEQLLYFLVDAISSTHVYRDELDGSPSARVANLNVPEPASELVDMRGAGDALVILSREDLLTLDLIDPDAAELADTRLDADELITDPTGAVSELLVLDEFVTAFHTSPEDGTPDIIARGLVAGVIDPVTRFGYGVADGSITILDLLTGADSGQPFRAHTEPLPELALPLAIAPGLPGATGEWVSAITWVRAAPSAPVP